MTHDAVANQQQHAAKLPGGAILERTPAIKDLAASDGCVFGWYEAPQTNVQFDEFRIIQEQQERIRALRNDQPSFSSSVETNERVSRQAFAFSWSAS